MVDFVFIPVSDRKNIWLDECAAQQLHFLFYETLFGGGNKYQSYSIFLSRSTDIDLAQLYIRTHIHMIFSFSLQISHKTIRSSFQLLVFFSSFWAALFFSHKQKGYFIFYLNKKTIKFPSMAILYEVSFYFIKIFDGSEFFLDSVRRGNSENYRSYD